jgi:hypothetical protein
MRNFSFLLSPQKEYLEVCEKEGSLFHAPAWQDVLKAGFGVETLYGWHQKDQVGCAISIFKTGVFRIGFLGFPGGALIKNQRLDDAFLQQLQHATYERPLHILRLTPSPFRDSVTLPKKTETTWETAVLELQSWDLVNLSSSIRRDVRKGERSLELVEAETSKDAQTMYQLYQSTIQRKEGQARYSLSYFQAVVALSQTSNKVRCILAKSGGEAAGFIGVVCSHKTAYYLHGSIAPQLRQLRASDYLLATAMHWAKDAGMEKFDMMASPLHQDSLARYKERWGGKTELQHTFNVPIAKPMGQIVQTSWQLYKYWQKVSSR